MHNHRYGIQGPVYLQEKNGSVLAPNITGDDCISREGKSNIIAFCKLLLHFFKGSISFTDHVVTVFYDNKSYSLKLFDHIRVRVVVQESHTHPSSFVLKLLSCYPVLKGVNVQIQEQRKAELMKVPY